ncbi:MAG: protease HtpX [Gammaproteobacteria bacterium]|nr:protease HtpX [Gammaproteobacteria bacterium]
MRLILYLLANFSIVAVLSVSMRVLGVDTWLANQGMPLQLNGLLIMALAIGFGGSLISLAMSKSMAIRGMGVRVIDKPANNTEKWLLDTVRKQAERAGIDMPDVGVFQAEQPNAFATGMRRNASLVAVSTGLMRVMDTAEVEAVLAHEVSHVANGDMVTMALLQGVLNTFVVFFSRVIGMLVDRVVFRTERGVGMGYFVASIVAELVLGIVAAIIAAWFSRRREFRADEGGAELAGRQNMIGALQALQRDRPEDLPGQLAAFGISGAAGGGLRALLRSHPPLDVRIAALEAPAR